MSTFFAFFSHFSLLLGCAFPIWMSSGFNDRPLAPFAGILSLGIGDTMVSVNFVDILIHECFLFISTATSGTSTAHDLLNFYVVVYEIVKMSVSGLL